jgi:flavin reductase (DIM6/NTAB) family NADH-FMN oxidoreductase RutF
MGDREQASNAFRLAMRRFAATVSVISTLKDGMRQAMTATAVTSLSMAPPSLLACVYRDSRFHKMLENQDLFCVNILHRDQADVSQTFSKAATAEDYHRFGWADADGFCYLSDSQATIFCRKSQQIAFGTHTIFIGTVLNVAVRDCVAPLVFQNGEYGFHTPLTD